MCIKYVIWKLTIHSNSSCKIITYALNKKFGNYHYTQISTQVKMSHMHYTKVLEINIILMWGKVRDYWSLHQNLDAQRIHMKFCCAMIRQLKYVSNSCYHDIDTIALLIPMPCTRLYTRVWNTKNTFQCGTHP